MNQVSDHIKKVKGTEEERIWNILETVHDPELPVLSILDLGIVRSIQITRIDTGDQVVKIVITPTYSGCPAMDMIAVQVRMVLVEHGYNNVVVETVLSPAWTTDWMTDSGKEKLRAYGIAPPNPTQSVCTGELFQQDEAVQCPHCSSYHTTVISQFGSTACKALYRCNTCLEPFDYFKCH